MATITDLQTRRAALEAERRKQEAAEQARLAAERAHRDALASIDQELQQLAQQEQAAEFENFKRAYRAQVDLLEKQQAEHLMPALERALEALDKLAAEYRHSEMLYNEAVDLARTAAHKQAEIDTKVPTVDDGTGKLMRDFNGNYGRLAKQFIDDPTLPLAPIDVLLGAQIGVPEPRMKLHFAVTWATVGEALRVVGNYDRRRVAQQALYQALMSHIARRY